MNFETIPFSSIGLNWKVKKAVSLAIRFNVSVSDTKQSQVEMKSILISAGPSLCTSSSRICMPESLVIESRSQEAEVMERAERYVDMSLVELKL